MSCAKCHEHPKAPSSAYCRECRNEYGRQYRAEGRLKLDPQKDRARKFRWKFGIEVADYDKMLDEQQGACAICGITADPTGRKFAVDHDRMCCPGKRSCGRCIRGLLCFACNTALGKFGDDTMIMKRAIAYIDDNRGSVSVVAADPSCAVNPS